MYELYTKSHKIGYEIENNIIGNLISAILGLKDFRALLNKY